ncbi:AbiJ-NTD4 domain-containing protein [Bacillus sp. AFS029533]|uniref:AbiJ-NTD4 domain-containing protein n=1 Tax=Bacillus sp. AFS029533 TaxID=2033494 RepID=UPI000BFD5904|nr:hypothetical protein [Bacillus sp. AFS029533]PGZ92193.1 hypothetical protein COE53_12580 [Bacillus sp. AFS029533]
MLFSERYGHKEVKQVIQIESMDEDLRVGLWNVLSSSFWSNHSFGASVESNKALSALINCIWRDYFKRPLDKLSYFWGDCHEDIREYFFFRAEWHEVYSFIEFVAKTNHYSTSFFRKNCNKVLEREVSAYRFVDNEILRITSDEEIETIEAATRINSRTHYAATHIQNSLALLADKQVPDYRNSMKESISAVESICKAIVGNSSTTLGRALEMIEQQSRIDLHPKLKESFKQLYGYTSDANGIRHDIKDDPNVDFEDAKLMLVSCSSFVNYLTSKATKAGIQL